MWESLKAEHDFNNKSESRQVSYIVEKSYAKTIIDINVGRHKDLSTLKSDIPLGFVASVIITFFSR